jgi:glycosyltransferase involved in cell wall biosynthesis
MRIAMLHWAFPPVIGGVESHLAMLGPELVRSDCRVSLLTGSVPGAGEEDWYEGMHIRRTPLMDLNSLTPEKIAGRAREIGREIAEFIETVRPDVIHAHNMHYFSPVHADILNEIKRATGTPLILTAHNVWADDDRTWGELKQRAGIWDAVIAVSGYIKRELVRSGYADNRITVIHHGIDLKRFHPATKTDREHIRAAYPLFSGRRVFFHPARMSLDKGCQVSVGALDIIRREFPQALLVLAGTENTVDWKSNQAQQVNQIMALIEELGLKDSVFVRFFTWDDMPQVYQAAEFSLYPSCFEEPFGLAMLESMATAKPIIVSRAGGMPEVVQDGVNGFVVTMANKEELADKCLELLRHPGRCRRMGRQGRMMVETYWAKEKMTRATLSVYRNAGAKPRHATGEKLA